MVIRPTGGLSVFFSAPWCCVLPAVLSFVSLGSAASARVALMKLMLPLLVLSVAFLTYAHLRVWVRKEGRPAAKIVLLVNTVLVALLWAWRLPF